MISRAASLVYTGVRTGDRCVDAGDPTGDPAADPAADPVAGLKGQSQPSSGSFDADEVLVNDSYTGGGGASNKQVSDVHNKRKDRFLFKGDNNPTTRNTNGWIQSTTIDP